jgi:hypothetical protein
MEVKRLAEPAPVLAAAESLLLADEARHNLMLGISGGLRDHPGLYHEFRGWVVEDRATVVGAALQTPPFNLVLARPSDDRAIVALVDSVRAEGTELPGVTGALPEAEEFGRRWTSGPELALRVRMRQRIYRVTEVRPARAVAGAARRATPADRPLLLEWMRAFAEESFDEADPAAAAVRQVDARLEHGTGGFAVWEDDGPVSLVGWGGATPNGIRIGPVYTPPDQRRRGYASALTAWVSADQLAQGRRCCFLYTDVANPTSNRIYMDVGYEPVCDSVDYAFDRAKSAVE